jgi:hypothetical protein
MWPIDWVPQLLRNSKVLGRSGDKIFGLKYILSVLPGKANKLYLKFGTVILFLSFSYYLF